MASFAWTASPNVLQPASIASTDGTAVLGVVGGVSSSSSAPVHTPLGCADSVTGEERDVLRGQTVILLRASVPEERPPR